MKKCSSLYKENRFYIFTLVAALIAEFIYISNSFSNAPIGDYMRYMCMLVPESMESGISFSTLWKPDNEVHRCAVQFLSFLINVKVFGYVPIISLYLGAIVRGGVALFLLQQTMADYKEQVLKKALWVIILFCLYNKNQWELFGQEFAFSSAVKILVYVYVFNLTNKFLTGVEQFESFFWLGISYIFTICLVSAGYFPAFMLAIILSLLLGFLVQLRQNGWKYWYKYIWLLLCLGIGAGIYLFGININSVGALNGERISLLEFIFGYLRGVSVFIGSCLLSTFELTTRVYSIVGTLFILFTILFFVLFVLVNGLKAFMFPMELIFYALSVFGLIYMGRGAMYGESYAIYSRYTVETAYFLAGSFYLCFFVIENMDRLGTINFSRKGKDCCIISNQKKKWLSLITAVFFLITTCSILASNAYQQYFARYRKSYYSGNIEKMYRIDELKAEDFATFQVNEDIARQCVDIMKKYKLGQFRD